jgi:hypothetical protein
MMAGGTEMDPAVMRSLIRRLRSAGDELDSTGLTAPGVPRAGDVAPLMAAVIAHLAESAGNAVIGLKAAGDNAERVYEDHLASDPSAADEAE